MTVHRLEAVFEDGVFRPVSRDDVPLSNGQHVRLTVETHETDVPAGDPLEALTSIFRGMTEEEVRLVEEVALDRSNFMRPPTSE